MNKKVLVYGDSIMKGVVLDQDSQKYQISNNIGIDELSREYDIDIVNKSKFGCTIEKGFTFLKRCLDKGTECDYVFIEFGGNDCDFDWNSVSEAPDAEHLPHTPISVFTKTLHSVIDYVKQHGAIPILSTLPPISAERYLKWICRNGLSRENILKWLGDVNAIYRYQEMYSRAIEKIAKMTNTLYIDLRETFLSDRKLDQYICADGIHPNRSGQTLIKHAVQSFIDSHRAVLAAKPIIA